MGQDFVTFKGRKYAVEGDGELDLSGKSITDINEIEGLEYLTDLKKLDLLNNQIKEIKGLENFRHLEYLDLSENYIKVIMGLEHLTNLQELNLYDNYIEEIKGLENLTKLQYLDLTNNQIKELKGLEHLKDLQVLYLNYNQIYELKGLDNLTNLKKLYLNGNDISEIKGLEQLTNLEELRIYKNPLRSDERHVVYQIDSKYIMDSEMPGVEEYIMDPNIPEEELGTEFTKDAKVAVSYCRAKKEGKVAFVTVGGTKYFVIEDILDLTSVGIIDVSEIQGLEHLVNLRILYLGDNKLQMIKGLDHLKNLQILDLGWNQITEIKGLECLTNLKEIDFRGNPIKTVDLKSIADFQSMSAQAIVKYCQEKAQKVDKKDVGLT